MKSAIATLLLALGTQAHAMAIQPDAIYDVFQCQRKVLVPDLGFSLHVEQGGIAGLTSLVINETFMGQPSKTEQDYVRQLPMKPGRLGAPLVYEGNNVRLSINMTTAPDERGGHYGVLEQYDAQGNATETELSCQAVMHAL